MILYLHGFKSSPQSFKAHLIGETLAAQGRASDYLCPQLPASPAAAVALALEQVQQVPANELTVIGSSLGGFYATWIAEQLGCRAVLLNPAVQPPRELEQYVGISSAYHSDDPFDFKHAYIDELRALAVPTVTRPDRYLLIAATGDAVLDWREMQAHYPGAQQVIIQGSDHGIADFAKYLATVLAFCDRPASTAT